MLEGLKAIMELLIKFCFFDDMKEDESSHFKRKMALGEHQEMTLSKSFLHQ